jgi:hypothetical protein
MHYRQFRNAGGMTCERSAHSMAFAKSRSAKATIVKAMSIVVKNMIAKRTAIEAAKTPMLIMTAIVNVVSMIVKYKMVKCTAVEWTKPPVSTRKAMVWGIAVHRIS